MFSIYKKEKKSKRKRILVKVVITKISSVNDFNISTSLMDNLSKIKLNEMIVRDTFSREEYEV
jgi:uncharacterized alpha-E superfamily protein